MRVHTAHQQDVDRRITEALESLSSELIATSGRHKAELALLLAELRRLERQASLTSPYD